MKWAPAKTSLFPVGVVLAALLAASLAGCVKKPVEVTVLAAASLSEVAPELCGDGVRFSFGPSLTLAHQVARGFPADLLLTASPQASKIVQGRAIPWCGNRLVLVAGSDWKGPATLEALTHPELRRLALGQPGAAPVGDYAESELQRLDLSLNFERIYQTDARAVLGSVRRGLCQAGIVYETDLRNQDGVRLLHRFPARSEVQYQIIVLRDNAATRRVVERLTSAEARLKLEKAGFSPAKEDSTPAPKA